VDLGSVVGLKIKVGCRPPNPSSGPISTYPSSPSSTVKPRTWHQKLASNFGSWQSMTSSEMRDALLARLEPGSP